LLHFGDLGIGRLKINIASQTEVEYEIKQDLVDEPMEALLAGWWTSRVTEEADRSTVV
jgi:hypothetical protein